jgi:hypothetical protein
VFGDRVSIYAYLLFEIRLMSIYISVIVELFRHRVFFHMHMTIRIRIMHKCVGGYWSSKQMMNIAINSVLQ